jgi:NitT/TauT family transport system substrate-binding protein
MYVAEQEGTFANHGIKVEFIPVASAPERDQILQAGQADATVNEILSDMFFNKEGVQMQVVRYAHMASPNTAHFFILASAQSGITSVEGLKGIEIGISQGTIIEYVTDRLLQTEGFSPNDIKTVMVPKIPDRMALLASGELKAGVLPDPLAALSVQQGAVIILDDTLYPTYGASVISFSKSFINQYPEAVKGFLAAIEEATAMVNSDPAKYASLLSDKQLVPPPLLGTYVMPTFPTAGITSEAEWNDALSWAKDKGLLTVDIPYSDSVNATFLP